MLTALILSSVFVGADAMKIACPFNLTVETTTDNASISFPAPVVSGGTPPVTLSCTPPSGSALAPGRSTPTCAATDGRRQTATCTFTITVHVMATIAATRFVAFGDSVTEGRLANAEVIQNGYPAVLERLMAGRYPSQHFTVRNRGSGGETTDRAIARLQSSVGADMPQIVLLMEGVNDLSFGDPAAIPALIANLQTMIEEARSRGVEVFVGTLLPELSGGTPDRSGARALVGRANDQIRAMAAKQGAVLVDLYQAFAGREHELIGGDGLHPNEAGYEKIAQTFFAAITQRFEPLPSRSFIGSSPSR